MIRCLFFSLLLAPQEDAGTQKLLDLLERRHRETPDPSDPRAAAARLGFDRQKIVDFVRASIAWEPYPGILRGASGTLLVRAGNSLDRSLLLQAMLEAAGEKVRLVRGELAPADAGKLSAAFLAQDAGGRLTRPESDPKTLAAELGLDPAVLEPVVREQRRREQELVEEVIEAAQAESARLKEFAGALGGKTPAAPREHVWTQVWDEGKRQWVDVDVSPVPITLKGARPIAPAELASQRRTVTIRLILNRKVADKIESTPLLGIPLELTEISWKSIELVLQPLRDQLPHVSKLREMDEKARLEAFRQAKVFRAGLVVAGKYYGSIPFDSTGKLFDVDDAGQVGAAKTFGKTVGNVFGGALGGGAREGPPSTLDSVVLEVAVKEPGGADRVHRRALFTAHKQGERVRMLPVFRASLLVDSAPLPPGERQRREVASLASNASALRMIVKGQDCSHKLNPHSEVSSLLLRFADLRRRILAKIAGKAPFVQDRPGIYAETRQLVIDEEAGRLVVRNGIDIFDNPIAIAGDGEKTLMLGVADTLLECLLVSREYPGGGSRSAWAILERERLQGAKAEASDREGRREIRRSADAWWSIDPSTGLCVGRVPSGAGQGMVEAAWNYASEVCNISDLVGFAAAVGPKSVQDAAGVLGKACSIVGGTWPRDKAMEHVQEFTQGLWAGAISALTGM